MKASLGNKNYENLLKAIQHHGQHQFFTPRKPILRTANMVKAIHWYCGDDRVGSTHSTGKVLEWVARAPLDDSPENLEAREELVEFLTECLLPY